MHMHDVYRVRDMHWTLHAGQADLTRDTSEHEHTYAYEHVFPKA